MFLVKIKWYDPYGKDKEYRIEAGQPHTAISRAMMMWRKEEFKGKKFRECSVDITKLTSDLL